MHHCHIYHSRGSVKKSHASTAQASLRQEISGLRTSMSRNTSVFIPACSPPRDDGGVGQRCRHFHRSERARCGRIPARTQAVMWREIPPLRASMSRNTSIFIPACSPPRDDGGVGQRCRHLANFREYLMYIKEAVKNANHFSLPLLFYIYIGKFYFPASFSWSKRFL